MEKSVVFAAFAALAVFVLLAVPTAVHVVNSVRPGAVKISTAGLALRASRVPAVAAGAQPRLVMFIVTGPKNFGIRTAIRKTLMACTEQRFSAAVKLVFATDNIEQQHAEGALKEADEFRDMFIDTDLNEYRGAYAGYAHRLIRMFEWGRRTFPSAVLFGKMDDDVFFCPNVLAGWARALTRRAMLGYPLNPRGIPIDLQFTIFGVDAVDTMLGFHAGLAVPPSRNSLVDAMDLIGKNKTAFYHVDTSPDGFNVSVHTRPKLAKCFTLGYRNCEAFPWLQSTENFCNRYAVVKRTRKRQKKRREK